MVYLPNEILNIVFGYVERPKHSMMIKYLINDCYENDYNPYTAENWNDNYCFQYTFCEWYYLYRTQTKLGCVTKTNNEKKYIQRNKYKHTPKFLLIGIDKLNI